MRHALRRRSGSMFAWLVGLTFAWVATAAEPSDPVPSGSEAQAEFEPRPFATFPVLEIRGGAQGVAGSGNAMICAELGLYKYAAFEACGSGAGFLYEGEYPTEMVHFRLEGTIPVWSRARVELLVQPGFGFAEIENGADEGGFLFGPARSPDQREGAGPEGAVGAKARIWPHERMFVTIEINGGTANIPSAPVVLGQDGFWVPFVTGTVGVGF